MPVTRHRGFGRTRGLVPRWWTPAVRGGMAGRSPAGSAGRDRGLPMTSLSCTVTGTGPVTISRPNRLADMYVLSPYVWREGDALDLLLRCVPRRDDEPRLKMSEIWHGRSRDGRDFVMDPFPCLFPGPRLVDLDGCEDPTVCRSGDQLHVWYTGVNTRERTGRLLAARGTDVASLTRTGIAIDSRPPFLNPKEAALAPVRDGWRLFFEYACDGLSAIGAATAATLDDPWRTTADAPLVRRRRRWDSGHMSPGPIVGLGGDCPIMFYNGAAGDASWRIGWAAFDRDLTRVVARCEQPLIVPTNLPGGEARDMAFVASAVGDDAGATLYFTVADEELRYAQVAIDRS